MHQVLEPFPACSQGARISTQASCATEDRKEWRVSLAGNSVLADALLRASTHEMRQMHFEGIFGNVPCRRSPRHPGSSPCAPGPGWHLFGLRRLCLSCLPARPSTAQLYDTCPSSMTMACCPNIAAARNLAQEALATVPYGRASPHLHARAAALVARCQRHMLLPPPTVPIKLTVKEMSSARSALQRALAWLIRDGGQDLDLLRFVLGEASALLLANKELERANEMMQV